MWNPIRIHFENLFAHEDSTYEFKNNTCTVIFGENKTDKGLENNGAGKTTLFRFSQPLNAANPILVTPSSTTIFSIRLAL